MEPALSSNPPAPPLGLQVGMVAVGLVTGLLSTSSASLFAQAMPPTAVALVPAFVYGALTGLYLYAAGFARAPKAGLFFIAVLVIWGAAVHIAPLTCGDWLRGSGFFCSLTAAGLAGGGAGAAALAVFCAFLFPAFRRPWPIAAMIAVGIATGGLLTFGEIAMFCGWQAGMNLVLGFTLPRAAAA
jgi:hypothetical protein